MASSSKSITFYILEVATINLYLYLFIIKDNFFVVYKKGVSVEK